LGCSVSFWPSYVASPFKSKLRLEAENAVLRHQLNVLRPRLHGRARLTTHDRWVFIQLYCWFPSILQALTLIRPETLVRWHRAGFRRYWRWKSRRRGGPQPRGIAGHNQRDDTSGFRKAWFRIIARRTPALLSCNDTSLVAVET
jgi:hypothetical protein